MARQPSRVVDSSDIVIIGAGGCGLTAALAAAQRGARVLILEKTDAPGGSTAMSGGSIPAAGTRFQREAGIQDNPDTFAEDVFRRNRRTSDPVMTHLLTKHSAAVVEWLADTTGIQFQLNMPPLDHTNNRLHAPGSGRALVEHLVKVIEREKNIRILWSTPVLSLQLNGQGAVAGVVTEKGVIAGRKVIIATGGYGASRDLLTRYAPKGTDLPYHGHQGSTGDGLRLGLGLGAAASNLDAFQPYPNYSVARRLPIPLHVLTQGGIHVDEHGQRFGDETKYPGIQGAKMAALPGKRAFTVFDERVFQATRQVLSRVIEANILEKADTVADLARRLGIDPARLERTIQAYNATVGRKDEFGRTLSAPLGLPLYGTQAWVALYHTQGGLNVNTNGQVLRPDGSVIPNLYAGGGAAVGVSGAGMEGYLPGNGLLASLGLGKLAGEHAAASLMASQKV